MTSRRSVLSLIGIGGIAAATLATQVSMRTRAQSAEQQYPPLGEFVEVEGGRLHYVQRGNGPHVVLLHGAGGNLRDFTFDMMDRLTDRYTVTAFDRPGMGYSDPAPGVSEAAFGNEGSSPLQQAAMLRDGAAALGITAPIVAGHSFGGIVTYAWGLVGLDEQSAVNASALVSFSGVALPWPGDLGAYYTVNGSRLGGAILAPLISAWVPASVVEDRIESTFAPQSAPEGYGDYIGAPLTLRPDPFRANVRQVATLRPHVVEMEKRYGELRLPIEIVHGSADTTVPLDIHSGPMNERFETVNLTVLEGVGHMPHHTNVATAIAAIDRAADRATLA